MDHVSYVHADGVWSEIRGGRSADLEPEKLVGSSTTMDIWRQTVHLGVEHMSALRDNTFYRCRWRDVLDCTQHTILSDPILLLFARCLVIGMTLWLDAKDKT